MSHNVYIENLKIDNSEMEQIKQEVYKIVEFIKNKYSYKTNTYRKTFITTILQNYYNIFNFKQYALNIVFTKIKNLFTNIYHPKTTYYISAGININKKGERFEFTNKYYSNYKSYHGYFALQLGDFNTFFKFNRENGIFIHKNKDGEIFINNNTKYLHYFPAWNQEYDRLFISFDILPFECIEEHHLYNNCFIPFV